MFGFGKSRILGMQWNIVDSMIWALQGIRLPGETSVKQMILPRLDSTKFLPQFLGLVLLMVQRLITW